MRALFGWRPILNRLRAGPDTPRRTEYYLARPISDEEREEQRLEDIAAGLDPDTGLPAEAPLGAKAGLPADLVRRSPRGESGSSSGSVLLRRGRLNNGNPGGDFLAAPRCGARTRAGCGCRQPAMANGRCRFHGGKSTGPRTEAGKARARSNRLVHGLRSAELITLTAAAAAAHRRLGALLAASAKKIHHRDHREGDASSARAARNHRSSVSSVVNLSSSTSADRFPAGHGVDRSESNNTTGGGATILPFTRPAPGRAPCRNRLPRVRS